MAKQTAQTANETIVIDSEAAAAAGKLAAEAVAIAKAADKQPTSELLTELKAKQLQHKINVRNFEPGSEGEDLELLEAYKTGIAIKAEIANIANIENNAKLQLQRNERIALNTKQFIALFGNSEAFEAAKAALTDESKAAFEAAVEAVNNELLAKFSSHKAATTKTADGTTKAAADGEIDAAAAANKASGMNAADNRKALMAVGYARSTAWFAVDRQRKADVNYL